MSKSEHRPSIGERRLSRVRFSISEPQWPTVDPFANHSAHQNRESRDECYHDYQRAPADSDVSPHTMSFPPAAHVARLERADGPGKPHGSQRPAILSATEPLRLPPSADRLVDSSRRDSDATLADEEVNAVVGAGQALGAVGKSCGCHEPPDVAARELKPALRRTLTEDYSRVALSHEAAHLVATHVHQRPTARPIFRAPPAIAVSSERDPEQPVLAAERGKAGVLSNLLTLQGGVDLRRSLTSSSWASAVSSAPSRSPSLERQPGIRRRRQHSDASLASELNAYTFYGTQDHVGHRPSPRRRSSSLSILPWINSKIPAGGDTASEKGKRGRKKLRRLSVTKHVADILLRHKFILKLAKALMEFGAPSHRIEAQLNAIADILDVDGHFIHIPSIVIASFGDQDTHTTETHFVKAGAGLDLGALTVVHEIYRQIVHDELGVEHGLDQLSKLLQAPPIYGLWTRVFLAFICGGSICMLGFDGSFVDGWISAAFGAILAFLQIRVAASNPMYSNIFEISMAMLVSFVGRGLATTHFFCYEAVTSSGVVLILPGYVILCGSLELASRNIIAGSVKLVYSIIYSLFLGFGIAVGSDLYFLVDQNARRQAMEQLKRDDSNRILGTFVAADGSYPPLNGTFTFVNAAWTDSPVSQDGAIHCPRTSDFEWWRQTLSPWWAFLLVPMFSIGLSLWNLQPIRSRQFPVMVVIACLGWGTNRLATLYIFNRSDVVSFIGAFVIGLLGNLYSRVFKGTAFTAMVTGVLFLVPSGIAAAGGLAVTSKQSDGDTYSNGLLIGFKMVNTAVGISTGLFFASFVIFSFFGGTKRSASLFAF